MFSSSLNSFSLPLQKLEPFGARAEVARQHEEALGESRFMLLSSISESFRESFGSELLSEIEELGEIESYENSRSPSIHAASF